jgi:branched-chain amino acid transport system ATP-binding protein
MSLLETRNLQAFYGDFQALFGIDLKIDAGEVVALIGANGAGKSTFLKSIAGLIPSPPECVRFRGERIGAVPADRVVALGIVLVPEGRRLFPSLTVEENLLLGAYRRRPGNWDLPAVYRLFPALGGRERTPASALSGGLQQMVAIGRALMSNPDLLMCDEISLGLAPLVIKELYATLAAVRGQGTALIVVEQDINQALSLADRVYCFQEGRVSLEGPPRDLTRERIKAAYFGL